MEEFSRLLGQSVTYIAAIVLKKPSNQSILSPVSAQRTSRSVIHIQGGEVTDLTVIENTNKGMKNCVLPSTLYTTTTL